MEDVLRNSVEDGRSLISYGVFIESISKHSSQNELVCTISLCLSNAGQTTIVRLRYTYEQFGGGETCFDHSALVGHSLSERCERRPVKA